MFRKLLSALTVMLVAFSINAGAQNANAPKRIRTATIEQQPGEFWEGYWDAQTKKGDFEGIYDSDIGSEATNWSVAIKYPKGSAAVQGLTITGIKFALAGVDPKGISDVKVWLSTTLPGKPESADITWKKLNLDSLTDYRTAYNEVRFDKPYKCQADKDICIGYTFSTTPESSDNVNLYKEAVILDAINQNVENSCWVGNVKKGSWFGIEKWKDFKNKGAAPIQVLLKGEGKSQGVIEPALGSYTTSKGKPVSIPLVIQNKGINAINNLTIEADVNGVKTVIDTTLTNPIKNLGDTATCRINVNVPKASGNYDLSVSIKKINGADFTSEDKAKGEIIVVSKVSNRKVFFEEFTGTWCGWCPRGLIALEKLKELYKDDIVLASIHVNDPMMVKEYKNVTDKVKGMPNCIIDRTIDNIDPYYGTSYKKENIMFYIDKDIQKLKKEISAAEIDVTFNLNEDSTIIEGNAEVRTLYSGKANLAIGYLLLEDSVHNETWKQSNDFYMEKGKGLENEEPMFEFWVNGDEYLYDIMYNDVVIAAMGIDNGLDNSVPQLVKEGEAIKHSVKIELNKYNIKGFNHNVKNMRLAAIIFNRANGKIVNANSIAIHQKDITTQIKGVQEQEDIKEISRYNISGEKISVPQKGINIVKFSDGSVKKVLVK